MTKPRMYHSEQILCRATILWKHRDGAAHAHLHIATAQRGRRIKPSHDLLGNARGTDPIGSHQDHRDEAVIQSDHSIGW
jgi:hypothetical protein